MRALSNAFDDILTGFGLLTRLPLPNHTARGANAGWSWPLVGLVVGLIGWAVGFVAIAAGVADPLAAVLVVGALVMVTGGLHEDGLADTADGLWGGWTRERRLEIMRDSRIGSYGVIALVLVLLARVFAVFLVINAWVLPALVAAAVLSRGVLPGVMALVSNAREDGLSRGVGRPSLAVSGVSAALAVVLGAFCVGWSVVAAVVAVLVVACGMALLARSRIGGQTGDILGAVQVLAEVAVLVVLVS
ncbi:adenosylcobinamide-GDP ribazoletransferase [Pseudooceanicola sp. MF1-13]|uniref:adenosylcobinamide-GDP ribazoletransferase n=1 Tax=Pseudooceanicola sp. MF1-13 TaxID=3379095 RepID=UPI003892867C